MQDYGSSALTAVRIPNSNAQTYLTLEVLFMCRGKKLMLQVKDPTQDSKGFFVYLETVKVCFFLAFPYICTPWLPDNSKTPRHLINVYLFVSAMIHGTVRLRLCKYIPSSHHLESKATMVMFTVCAACSRLEDGLMKLPLAQNFLRWKFFLLRSVLVLLHSTRI